jgi:hypothetical protein
MDKNVFFVCVCARVCACICVCVCVCFLICTVWWELILVYLHKNELILSEFLNVVSIFFYEGCNYEILLLNCIAHCKYEKVTWTSWTFGRCCTNCSVSVNSVNDPLSYWHIQPISTLYTVLYAFPTLWSYSCMSYWHFWLLGHVYGYVCAHVHVHKCTYECALAFQHKLSLHCMPIGKQSNAFCSCWR